MAGAPFYASGLKFSCKRCSSCCRYDPGFVFLSENDLGKLTSLLKMERSDFIKTYCRWVVDLNGDEVLSLKEKSNKDCIFWDNGCLVYQSRPLQCITFPFWKAIVSSKEVWNTTASGCPGINNGTLNSEKKINDYLEMRMTEPIINKSRGKS